MAVDYGIHTPLVDLFTREDLPVDMRLLAATNQVSADPVEQVALLALLADDPEPQVASQALATWHAVPAASVADLITHADTSDALRVWMLTHASSAPHEEPAEAETAPAEAGAAASRQAGGVEPVAPVETAEGRPAGVADTRPGADTGGAPDTVAGGIVEGDDDVRQLASLPVPARIKIAMLGTREQRGVLIRDSNRVVSTAVLSSPKLSESEVENFARMTNVSADVLRIIGTNRAWLRNYAILAALVRNPRTPPAISLSMVPRLQERELKALTVDRNVPEALRVLSRKALLTKDARRG